MRLILVPLHRDTDTGDLPADYFRARFCLIGRSVRGPP